ncbi:hypothetical protein Enr13x_23260 [Stieleria neptunia]|uniref:Immunity MXAN-0049 protein domain-containing protein n=1 Tax=Stieleria neptunia TaxID=2527979 RepID=A0A518HNS0_9BACT|nr:DUF1629 domain-containing protein [Stieleria neptunia]QDV42479.1 hypothetical protein Enr13x_23260 [Stieleria neptunia]
MTGKWYQLTLREGDQGEALLKVPVDQGIPEFNIWDLSAGSPLDLANPLQIELERDGVLADIYLTAFDVMVVSPSTAEILRQDAASDIQLIDAVCSNGGEMFVANILSSVDCIDREQSSIIYHEKTDRFTRRKAGDIQVVTRLVVDKSKLTTPTICRVSNYRSAIILRQDLAERLQHASLSGVAFVEV